MPDPSVISFGVPFGDVRNFVDNKGNLLHFDQTDLTNGRLEQGGWTTETNFWRDENGNEYIYDQLKSQGRGDEGFVETIEREKGVKLTKAGANERPSNYLEEALLYAMPDGSKTAVRLSDKEAFVNKVKKDFQRDPSKVWDGSVDDLEAFGVNPLTTRRINGVFLAVTDRTSSAIDDMARANGGTITAQMMAEAGFTPSQLMEGQKWMTGKLKQNEEAFKNKYGPMGFREYEEKVRATSMGGDSLGRTYARQALQQMPKSIGVKSFDEQVRDYGADNGLQLLKERTWIGKALDAIGYGGLAHKETWDWMFMSDEEQYEVFKTLNEELKRNEYEAEVRDNTWQASVGSGAIDMGLYALDMMPAAVFSTATGTGLKGGLGAYTGTHIRGKATEQKANKMAYDPLTGGMISIAPGREGWSAWLYGGANAALDYGIEHGGGKLLGALEKKIIGMPMRKLTQRVLGRETAIVMGLAPGVINPSKMGLAARLSSKAQRGFLKVFGSDSWLSGLQKATGIRLLSPSGFLEELNEEITQNSIVGLLNLDGTAVDEQGRLRALSLGNAAKAIVETVKASPEMFGQMALYSLGVGPLTRGTHMLTGAYGSKAALKQGLKALGMTDEQLKGMSRADLKKAFEERLSAQDKGIYQADLDAVMDEMDGKSNAELIGELAKQGWNMTLSEDGQTLEYIDPEQSQKQEAERVEAEAQREETTSDIQLYDEGFAQAQQAKQNTTTIRGEAAIKEHLLGIIEQSLKRDGIRAYHTAKQSYDIGVALTQMTRRELKDVKRHLFNNDLDAAFGFIGNRDVYDTLVESMAVDYLAKSGRYKGTLAERVLRQYAEQLKGQAIIEAEETGWTRDKADDVRETIAAFNRYFMGNTLEDVDISGEKPARAFTESDNELKAAGQHTTEDGVVFTSTGDGSYTVYYQGNLNDYSVVGIAGFSYAMPVFAETMRNEFSSYDEALAYANELNAKVKKFKSERDELGKFAQDVARRTLGLTPDEDSGMTFINSVFDDRDIFNEVYGLVLNKMGGDHAKAMQFIGSVRGVRLSDGRTVVFLNNISSRSELVLTIRHELTHKGSNASGLTFRDDWGLSSELVKGLKGAELNKVLKEVFEAAGVPFIGTLGERVQNFDKLDEAEKVRVLDETLAAVAEILDDKPGLAGRISNRLWGLFSKKTGLKDLTAAQILEEVRNITSDTFARARLDIRQGKKGTRANVRDYAGDIRTAAALGAIAEDEAIENEAEAKRQQMKATIDELNRQESEARAQEEEAERRRGGRGRRRRGRKHEPAGETVEGDIDRIRMDENAPQQPTPEQPEPEDAEYDFKSTRQQEMERKQAEAMDGGSRYGTVVMPEIQPEPSRMIADKPDEEKAAEEAERIRLHNRRVDAYVKYLYRHRGEPLPSRYGVIQIWPEDVLKLPPPPADPAERLDPKAKKDWNWAEHLATLAYRQEQEYQRLKTDPQALTEDKLKAAMNAFKLYKSASMYAEKSGMTEAVKRLNAAFWRMEHEIERNFLEPEARRKVNQKKHSKDIKALQKSFDEAMDNAKPRLEDDERSRVWNRIVLDYLMFKAEAAFAEALTKGLKKVGKKKWNAFRGPIINAVRKLANDAASPEGWLAKRLENPSVADADAIKAFIAEAFGLEPDAIPMGWTSMMDELAVAMEEMTKGIRGYLDWSGPAPTLDLARPTAAGISMEDASHLTEMMRTPAQPREEAQPEPTPEPTPVEQEPIPDPTPEPTPEQPVEQKPAQPKSEWEEREDLDADLEEPFDADETEGAWRPRAYGKPGMENANGEVAYDWKEEGGLLVAEEDGETISGGRKNFQDEADEALGNIAEALPSVEGNVVYLQTGPLEPGKAPTKLVVFGESAQTIAGALDAANVTYRDNFDSIDEKIDEGKETRDGDAYDESHYKVTISGKKNVQAAIQALVGDNGDYGAVVLQDEGGSIRIMLNPKSVDIEGVTTLAQAQAANEQLKQGIEERNRQAIAAWEARTGLKYDPEWREHVLRPDGPFRERTGSYIREGTIRNGEWNGEVREYRDGVLRKTAIYKNGSETGTRKLYRGDGTLALDRFFNEDGNAVEIHYGKDGKTEEYRLVLGKRKVLFDSRNEQKTDPQEEVEPEAKPTDSWEGKTIEAIVQDIRAIRETPRADHTSPLLKPGATQQKDGTVLHVEPENGSRDVRVYRTNKNGKKVGEEKAFRRIWNDAVTGKPEFDDFLTLYESTRYDDNGNPVEILSYDPDGRIHGRERFRSWRDDNGEWHTKSVDSFVVDEDGVYIGREGKTTDVLPLDVLGESRGQTANTAQEERPATALEADEALNWAGERFRNRRAAEAIAQDTALPETGAEGTSDLDGLSANTALSVGGFGLNANARAEMEKVRKQYEGTDKWMKAPNGKPTKLTRRLWLLVRTPAFKRWFGDWENDPANASKVVDENGEPLVVYHGSENAGFTTFDSDYWDEGMLGNFASSEEFVASTYSGVGIFKGDPDTPLVRGPALNSEDEPDSRPGNYALFLNIRKPLVVDAQGHNWNDIPAEGKDDYVEASDLTDEQLLSLKEDAWPPIDIELEYDEDGNLERWSHLELAEVIEENYVQEELDEDENVVGYSTPLFHKDTLETTTARQLTQSTRDISNWALRDDTGWDGVIFRNVIDMGQYSDGGRIRKASDVFVTKEGPQLKSAVRNTGNFNPENPDIRLSVGERMGGRAPTVEPGGDVREAGEGALAWLRRKFVHSQTPVFDAVRRVMGVGREPPDALNVEAAAKNVHGKIRARQEMLQRAYLEPLKAILAQPGMDRKRFDDYALALHALERNRMIQERSVVVDPTTGEVVDLGVEAGSGVTNAWAERVIREIQRDPFAEQYKEAANILAEMNRFVLRGAVADGLLTEAQAATWMWLSPHYVPLILSRLRACYRTQDAPGEAWKFGGLEVWLWRPVLVVLLVLFVLPRV